MLHRDSLKTYSITDKGKHSELRALGFMQAPQNEYRSRARATQVKGDLRDIAQARRLSPGNMKDIRRVSCLATSLSLRLAVSFELTNRRNKYEMRKA